MIPTAAAAPQLTGLAGWVVDVVDTLGPIGVGLLVRVLGGLSRRGRPRRD